MTRYGRTYLGLTLALVAVVGLGIFFASPRGRGTGRPDQIEAVVPAPGELVPAQTHLEVDVRAGYALELFVDGWQIPATELFTVEGTGLYSWQTRWSPGPHEVLVRWATRSGVPDVGEYRWTFRAY